MSLIKTAGPLFLFTSLLITLAVSVYFGNKLSGLTNHNGMWNGSIALESMKDKGNGNIDDIFMRNYTDDVSDDEEEDTSSLNPISDYYRWLAFWNIVADSNDPTAALKASNYVPKTSIVPPVCPMCPSCNSGKCGGGVCPNCGGYGGSGTQGVVGNGYNDYNRAYGTNLANKGGTSATDLAKTTVDNATGLAAGAGIAATGLVAGAGYGAYRLAEDAGSGVAHGVQGAANLTKEAVGGTVDLTKEAVGGTVDLTKEAVGGTVDLTKEAVGGTVGLAKDAGSGLSKLLTVNPTQVSGVQSNDGYRYSQAQGYGQTQGTYQLPNQPLGVQRIDPYSYNGALANKGTSNYIPITTDFSAFGK